jgi:hypothetical protein
MSNALDKTSKRKQINGDTQATRDKSVKKRKLAEEEAAAAAAAVVAATTAAALAIKEESARKKLKKKSTPSPLSLFPNNKPIEQQSTGEKNKRDKAATITTPSTDGSTGSLNKKKKKKNKDKTRPSPFSPNTTATTIDGDMLSPSKKNVRFSLKRNLVMTIGQPPAPADVRTPPSSKPKGPALKKVSTLGQVSPPMRLDKPHHGMGLRRVSAGEVLDRPTVYGNGSGGMKITIPGSGLKHRRHSHSGGGDGRQQQQQLHSRFKF